MPGKIYGKETEVATAISVPVKTLRQDRYLKKGIPFTKKGRSVLYRWSDVIEFMEQNKIRTTN